MRRVLLVASVIVAAFVAGSLATAATGWKVFASGTDSGTYGAYASANADITNPTGLALRVSRTADIDWFVTCQGKFTAAPAGRVLVVDVLAADKCSLNGSAITHSRGSVRVDLLRR